MMAGRGSDGSTEWRKIEEEVTCSVCGGLFVEPKTTISCLHTFCRKCIQIMINNSDSRDCPVCKAELAFPQDISKIPTNSTLQLKADMVRKRKAKKCGECEDDDAPTVVWCVDCDGYLCRKCNKQHKRMKSFKLHKTMTIEQFDAQSPNALFTSQDPEYRICTHHNRPLDFYCKTCNITICRVCVTKDHHQHQYDFVNKIADGERDKIYAVAAQLETTIDEVKNHIRKVENADNELNNETDVEMQIQNIYGQEHLKLDKCKAKDLEKVKVVKTALQIPLGSQKENLKYLLTCLSSCNEYIHRVVIPAKEVIELRECYDYVQNTVTDLTNQVKQSSLEPVYGVSNLILSTIQPNDHFTSLCKVSTLPHPPNCIVKGSSAMTKYGPINVTIILKDEDGRPVPNQTEHLTVYFKDENISNNVKMEEEKSKDIYVLSYNANKRETHNLSVLWKGQHLGEITVQENIRDYLAIKEPIQEPITKYGEQNELNLNGPHLMALGPNDELIVCDCYTKTLVVFDNDLKFSRTIAVGEPPPTGLAISKECLYISTNHIIKKVRMDGEIVFKFGGHGTENGQFNSPCGLVLNKRGQLYVCDKNNHRIQVLQENQFMFSFGRNGRLPGMFNEPYDLAFNNLEDLIFIADCSNHRIQLFTASGQFLKLFGDLTKIPGKLHFPTGICYTPDDHVLVCSSNSHCMLIFKEDGTFVSVVAIEGVDGEQAYADPVGVVMKNDGCIIVAGCNSNKLVPF